MGVFNKTFIPLPLPGYAWDNFRANKTSICKYPTRALV